MYPHERSLVEQMKGKPFALVGVNSDNPLARAREAVERNQINWRSFQDAPAGAATSISDAWGVSGWPTIVVLDGDRQIHYRGHDGDAAAKIAGELVQAIEKKGR